MSPTLAGTYSRTSFLELAEDLLPDVIRDTRKVSNVSSTFVEVTSLGLSNALDLQILEVKVSGSIDKRVAIASEAFKLGWSTWIRPRLRSTLDETGQLVTFPTNCKAYTLDNGKTITKFSNPRRFADLLGPGSKLNDAVTELISKGMVKDFDDLSNRFAVEVVK